MKFYSIKVNKIQKKYQIQPTSDIKIMVKICIIDLVSYTEMSLNSFLRRAIQDRKDSVSAVRGCSRIQAYIVDWSLNQLAERYGDECTVSVLNNGVTILDELTPCLSSFLTDGVSSFVDPVYYLQDVCRATSALRTCVRAAAMDVTNGAIPAVARLLNMTFQQFDGFLNQDCKAPGIIG